MQTPRKANPAKALMEQIGRYKALNFDSDEDMEETVTQAVNATHNAQAVQTAASSSNTHQVQPATALSKSIVAQPVQAARQEERVYS